MSKYCCTLALIVVCIGSSVCLAQSSREQKWEPPDSQFADVLDEAIVKNSGYRKKLLESLRALGAEVIPDIRHYLNHPTIVVRQRALYILLQIPEVARDSLLEALRGEDEYLRRTALRLAGPIMNDPEVGQAWVNCFAKLVSPSEGGRGDAFHMFVRLAPEIRKPLEEPLVVGILENLEKYSARNTAFMTTVLGEIAEPGDERVLESVARVRDTARKRFLKASDEWWVVLRSEADIQRIHDAVEFTAANLGDAEAMASFAKDVAEGNIETKKRKFRLLKKFRPTWDVNQIALNALDDKTELYPAAPGLPGHVAHYRACDIAVSNLAAWYHDFPLERYPLKIHTDEELAEAKLWLIQRLYLGSDHEPSPRS